MVAFETDTFFLTIFFDGADFAAAVAFAWAAESVAGFDAGAGFAGVVATGVCATSDFTDGAEFVAAGGEDFASPAAVLAGVAATGDIAAAAATTFGAVASSDSWAF